MLFLIDSNVAIAADPLSTSLEPGAANAVEFLRLVSTHHHDLRTHPASLIDIDRDRDEARRNARQALTRRYEPLRAAPTISDAQRAILGEPALGSNDDVDQQLLAAIVGDAAEYLVTDDTGIHRLARRMDVSDRVLTVSDAVSMLRALHAEAPVPPPAVLSVKTHELNLEDPIFDGLRSDYVGFEGWFTGVARTQRDALLIKGTDGHAAIAILKTEPTGEHGIPGPLLKICTFKVADGYSGQKYGELLLKAIFDRVAASEARGLYVTVFEKHAALRSLFEDFGFTALPDRRTNQGELILAKDLAGTVDEGLSPLAWHVRYGPPAVHPDSLVRAFLVPIEPRWHRILFPDAEVDEGTLFPIGESLAPQPFGNALRKAYLCNASTRLLQEGDPLLFYRSGDEKAVFVVGVCEGALVSRESAEIVATVGRRTVYSVDEIHQLTQKGDVLVVMFRQDRVLKPPIRLQELQDAGLVFKWPQSITRIRSEGTAWLQQRLGV